MLCAASAFTTHGMQNFKEQKISGELTASQGQLEAKQTSAKAKSDESKNMIEFGILLNNKDLFEFALKNGFDVNAQVNINRHSLRKKRDTGKFNYTTKGSLLIKAIREGCSIEIVHLLLNAGLKVNSQDSEGWTALHHILDIQKRTILSNDYENPEGIDVILANFNIIQLLLAQPGIDCTIKNFHGETPLAIFIPKRFYISSDWPQDFHISKHQLNVIKLLLAHGAEFDPIPQLRLKPEDLNNLEESYSEYISPQLSPILSQTTSFSDPLVRLVNEYLFTKAIKKS